MFLKGKLLLLFNNDDTIYRLLLTALFFTSPVLHFLFYDHSIDPLAFRLFDSFLALVTLLFSIYHKKQAFRIARYVTMVSYIVINNFILLSVNNFASEYLFCSLILFVVITLFCQSAREFLVTSIISFAAIVSAYLLTGSHNIALFTVIVIVLAFDTLACIAFITKLAYRYRFKRAVKNIVVLNQNLMKNDEQLRESKKQLTALINSINDVIFELDANRNCINVWYSDSRKWHFDPRSLVGIRLADKIGAEKAWPFSDALDKVFEKKEQVSIEFPSVFGADMWFMARMVPIFISGTDNIDRVAIAVSDITAQKKNAIALQENEERLLEAQQIARIGHWWYDDETGENYWSDMIFTMLETDVIDPNKTRFEHYMSLVHPDDLERTQTFFANIRISSEREFTHKLVTPKGNLKYIKIVHGGFVTEGSSSRISGIIQDVTEAKLAEKTIKLSQIELVEAQTIARIGNWKWDVRSNSISWSDEVYRIYEIADGSRAKLSIVKVMLHYTHPDDKGIIRDFLRTSGKGIHQSYEYRIITALGKLKYLSIIIGKVMYSEDGSIRKIIGTLQDITERREAELENLRTRSKYQLVLETIKLAAVTLDAKGNITFCNKYFANLLGYEQNELIDVNLVEALLPENYRDTIGGWFKSNIIPLHYINPLKCRNGEERTISWQNTVSYDDAGNIIETTSIGEDITDQQKATQALVSAKEQAERLSQLKSEFLSVMSHEIRTPMNAVIGTTNLLLAENPRPDQMEYLNTLKFSGENLLAIINDILDYNKIEAGKLELSHLPFNVRHLASQIRQAFYPRAAEKMLELELFVSDGMPDDLLGDQVRLSQVLNNLLSNAIKFTAWGKVTIRLEHEWLAAEKVQVKFTITDTGIGIAPENLGRIFEPFMQESQYTYNEYGGTGLGLAITRRLVEKHGSTISVISKPGQGTTFGFAITFDVFTKQPEQVAPANQTPRIEHDLAGMNILIVDDNKMNLLIASKFLKKWGADTDEALNGQIAVEMSIQKKYDVIIMDLQMPVMDGFAATAIIKQQQPLVPIIALTADAMNETYTKALAAGMDDLLTKPFVPDVLFEKVARYKKTLQVE